MPVALATEPTPEDESTPSRPKVTLIDDSPFVSVGLSTSKLPFQIALEERFISDQRTGEVRRKVGDEPGYILDPTMTVNWGLFTLDSAITLFPLPPHEDWLWD